MVKASNYAFPRYNDRVNDTASETGVGAEGGKEIVAGLAAVDPVDRRLRSRLHIDRVVFDLTVRCRARRRQPSRSAQPETSKNVTGRSRSGDVYVQSIRPGGEWGVRKNLLTRVKPAAVIVPIRPRVQHTTGLRGGHRDRRRLAEKHACVKHHAVLIIAGDIIARGSRVWLTIRFTIDRCAKEQARDRMLGAIAGSECGIIRVGRITEVFGRG